MEIKNNDWKFLLKEEFTKDYFKEILNFLNKEYNNKNIYPPKEELFSVFNKSNFADIKVVILGQDPYHQKGQGNGIAFSVNEGIKLPPSLRNIYKEIENEFQIKMSVNGNLLPWLKQGVFLLNTVLTVEESKANSHKNIGWEIFTDEVIKILSLKKNKLVFLLWGKNAQDKEKLIDVNKHLILKSSHPSPLSVYRGFWGNNHFLKANEFLKKNNLKEIKWNL